MKKFLRIILFVGVILVLAIASVSIYITQVLPNVSEAPLLKLEYTPERIARGKYLANSVTVCMDCHSKRDWSKFSGPLTEGTLGMGGDRFDQTAGFPGVYFAKNITPAGISRYTDGELYRVITSGVNKDGRAMFPVMPYPYYGKMDQEDIYSIIAYLRTLPAIENEVPDSKSDFPMSLIINTIPSDAIHTTRPDTMDILGTGAYLTNAAGCAECHTPAENGQIIPAKLFSGGREFQFPDGSVVRSLNITPHKTGMGELSEAAFIQLFKAKAMAATSVKPGELNSVMPWTMYAGMTDADLRAIYKYLMTMPPIENKVERFSGPPTAP